MAEVNIKYACGCGFTTNDAQKAIDHVEKTGHTISSMTGTIKPSTKK